MHMIEHRRKAKLDLAKRLLGEAEESNRRQGEANCRSVWYQWIEDRLELRKGLTDEANVKRRRLDREKRAIERPKNGGFFLAVSMIAESCETER